MLETTPIVLTAMERSAPARVVLER